MTPSDQMRLENQQQAVAAPLQTHAAGLNGQTVLLTTAVNIVNTLAAAQVPTTHLSRMALRRLC
jgi:hypothetical protein